MVLSTFRNSYFRTSDEYRQRSKKFFEVIGNFENTVEVYGPKNIFLPSHLPFRKKIFLLPAIRQLFTPHVTLLLLFLPILYLFSLLTSVSLNLSYFFLFTCSSLFSFPFSYFSPRINTANVPVPWGGGGVFAIYTVHP
jgi:hypothetical protein